MKKRVVIVGGGFAGIEAAKALRHAHADITLVDRSNHFVFQPLLYQVATGALAPSDIAVPIRWVLRSVPNVTVLEDNVESIDKDQRRIRTGSGSELEYDYLILAAGSRHAYFGHDDWEPYAPGLKTIEDALEVRNRFLAAFEAAERAETEAERREHLTIVIVGGGPTGVELAGIMVSIAREALSRDFRRIDPATARIILVEAGPRLVPAFQPHLSERALQDLRALGVEVRLNVPVTEIGDGLVRLGDEEIASRTVFWAAGNRGSSLSKAFPDCVDRAWHVKVSDDLSLPGHPEIFVAGDQAAVSDPGGTGTPRGAAGDADGCARRQERLRGPAREAAQVVPLPHARRPGCDRTVPGSGGVSLVHVQRRAGMVSLALRAHPVSGRIPEQIERPGAVGLCVRDLAARRAADPAFPPWRVNAAPRSRGMARYP